MAYGFEIGGEDIDFRTLQLVVIHTTTTSSGSTQLSLDFTNDNCVAFSLSLDSGKVASRAAVGVDSVLRWNAAYTNSTPNNKIYVFRVK